jgi:hypothetical protein
MTRKNIVIFFKEVGIYGRTSHHVISHHNMRWNTWHEKKNYDVGCNMKCNVIDITQYFNLFGNKFWRDSFLDMGSYDI